MGSAPLDHLAVRQVLFVLAGGVVPVHVQKFGAEQADSLRTHLQRTRNIPTAY